MRIAVGLNSLRASRVVPAPRHPRELPRDPGVGSRPVVKPVVRERGVGTVAELGVWRRVAGLLAPVLVLAAACGSGDSPGAQGDTQATASPSPARASYDPSDPAVVDAVFLTAVEEVLRGTRHEGLADEEPGELLATADAICARLDAGDDPDELLSRYLDALEEASGEPTDDADAILAGAILGAGVELYCPQYSDHAGRSEGS